MYTRLKRWFRRLFGRMVNYQDQFIFMYWDGTELRSADPSAVEMKLCELLDNNWLSVYRDSLMPIPQGAMGDVAVKIKNDRDALRKKVIAAVCVAFDVHPYVGRKGDTPASGLIDPLITGLLNGYLEFCADLITLARPFENAQSRASPSPENPPQQNGAGSS